VVHALIQQHGGMVSSQTKDFVRYHNEWIQSKVFQMNQIEVDMNEQVLMPWIRNFADKIAEH